MSRTKSDTSETAETKEVEKKMGLEFYLQQNPQKFTIAQLMRSKYRNSVKTENEWNETLAQLLGKKVIS